MIQYWPKLPSLVEDVLMPSLILWRTGSKVLKTEAGTPNPSNAFVRISAWNSVFASICFWTFCSDVSTHLA